MIGVNFAAGMSSGGDAAQRRARIEPADYSSPSAGVLQVLNAPAGRSTVNSVSTTTTATALATGSTQLPFFTDGTTPISGAITAIGSQVVGLAGRITVNSAVAAAPGSLVAYQTSPATAVGDPTRPNFLLNQLTTAALTYSPTTGVGSATAPFSGTLSDFMSQITSQQSQSASAATSLQQGQDVVVNALQQRFNSDSGVDINTELSNLITLQQAYASNARVMSTIQSMFTTLMQIGV